MSHWMPYLQKAVWDRLRADNGTGGLFASGAELVNAVYMGLPPENAAGPAFIVMTIDDMERVDTARVRSVRVAFSLIAHVTNGLSLGQDPSTTNDALLRAASVTERVYGDWDQQAGQRNPTYGLDGYKMTIGGSSPAWSAQTCKWVRTEDVSDAEWLRYAMAFEVQLDRVAV